MSNFYNSGRGGKRRGAGRPTKEIGGYTVHFTGRLSISQNKILEENGGIDLIRKFLSSPLLKILIKYLR